VSQFTLSPAPRFQIFALEIGLIGNFINVVTNQTSNVQQVSWKAAALGLLIDFAPRVGSSNLSSVPLIYAYVRSYTYDAAIDTLDTTCNVYT
jgi:hypothetical protein